MNTDYVMHVCFKVQLKNGIVPVNWEVGGRNAGRETERRQSFPVAS